jgi:hypothetical protein
MLAKVRASPRTDVVTGGRWPRPRDGHADEGGTVLEDAIDRLRGLDDRLDGRSGTGALATALAGPDNRSDPLEDRTDALVSDLRDDLIDLIIQPRQLTRAGRPSAAAERRAQQVARCFDEGYLVGRVGLDTHGVVLRCSTARHTVRLGALRSLVLHPRLTAAYAGTHHLAAVLRDRTDQIRGVPADQAGQFAGLGLLTAVAEWTVIVNGPRPSAELQLAAC